MENNSGIIPVGYSILVKPDEVEETTQSGIILSTHTEREREELRQTDGIVIAISPMAYEDEKVKRCKVGDRVIMAAYAGMRRMGNDGLYYRLINDNDVKAVLENKGNRVNAG